MSMKSKIHGHHKGIRNAMSKTPHPNHRQKKQDRIGALIAFGIFFGTFLYVLIERYVN